MSNALTTIKDMVNSDYVKARFAEVMGSEAPAFLASILNAMRTNPSLRDCDPQSVISSAMVAATLRLPIDGSLGFSALVPYKTKGVMVAQFQIMTKGFVQLALRTGQYQRINVGPVYEDEFDGLDIISGEVRIHPVEGGFRDKDDDSKIVGYACYFKLVNGYECTKYWPVDKIRAHGKRYSKSYDNQYGLWQTNFRAMAEKTVLKNTLAKWGILSTTMQMAVKTDQAAVHLSLDKSVDEAEIDYIDGSEAEEMEARPAEEVVKPAANATATTPTESPKLADIKGALMDYMDSDATPKMIRDDIAQSLKATPADAVILGALLNKVKAAIK